MVREIGCEKVDFSDQRVNVRLQVGGTMSEGEATGLIRQVTVLGKEKKNLKRIKANNVQADRDGNEKIDFSEFSKLWMALRGEGEVRGGRGGWL